MKKNVPVRELRNNSADVLTRVARGEVLTVTRDGEPVASIGPMPKCPIGVEQLIARRRTLPTVDLVAFRADLDDLLDAEL